MNQRAIAEFYRMTRRIMEIDARYEEIHECFERCEVPTEKLCREMRLLSLEDMELDEELRHFVNDHSSDDYCTYSPTDLLNLEWQAYRRTRRRLKDANGGLMPKTLHGLEWWNIPLVSAAT